MRARAKGALLLLVAFGLGCRGRMLDSASSRRGPGGGVGPGSPGICSSTSRGV